MIGKEGFFPPFFVSYLHVGEVFFSLLLRKNFDIERWNG